MLGEDPKSVRFKLRYEGWEGVGSVRNMERVNACGNLKAGPYDSSMMNLEQSWNYIGDESTGHNIQDREAQIRILSFISHEERNY